MRMPQHAGDEPKLAIGSLGAAWQSDRQRYNGITGNLLERGPVYDAYVPPVLNPDDAACS
jgi:hypothetical protein